MKAPQCGQYVEKAPVLVLHFRHFIYLHLLIRLWIFVAHLCASVAIICAFVAFVKRCFATSAHFMVDFSISG